ncbi:MAG: TonB-dependent receptor [Acidobacteria bacterium]|nr:TonB-dependent receptor [Acidobacteriota bacterium]
MERRSKLTHQAIQVSSLMRLSWGLLVFMLSGSLAMAQLTRGNISGTVTDQTGGTVPGAEITITNVNTGVTRETVTADSGRYEALSLPAGNYEIRASLTGFQTSIRAGITLTVGRTAVVDHILQVGEVTEAVIVTEEAAFVETTTATVSQVVNQQQVEDLPLPGRDMMELAFLQPGVLRIAQRNDQRGFSGMGEKMTVAGARGQQNNFLIDGVSNNDLSGNPQGASGAFLGAESVQEFQIITNNYSAEYRSQAGAIVSAVTKSGTNALHGSLFWTHRNDNLDAARWEDNAFGGVKPEFKRNQFGGSLGGPIVPDQTFFFGSYEGLRERLDRTEVIRILHPDVLQGIIGSDPAIPIDPDIQPYLAIMPVGGGKFPILEDFGDGTVRSAGTSSIPTDDDFLVFKIDHQLSGTHSLSGTYNYNDSIRQPFEVFGGLGDGSPDGLTSTKHVFGVYLNSVISPTTLNEFRVGYSFSDIQNDLTGITDDFTGLQFHPDRELMGRIEVGEATNVGWENLETNYTQKGLTFKDDLSLGYGNHSLQIGVEVTRNRFNQRSCSSGCNGLFEFGDVEDFLENKPKDLEMYAPGRDTPDRGFSQLGFGAYIQDNWQVRPSFTLNLGLRYEFVTVPKEDDEQIANIVSFTDENMSLPASQIPNFPGEDPPFAGTIDSLYTNATLKSFSPRIGFAWAPDSRTSIRAGVGIFYDHPRLYHIRTTMQELYPYSVVGEPSDDDSQDAFADDPLVYEGSTLRGTTIDTLRMFHQEDAGRTPAEVFAPLLFRIPNARHPFYQQENATIYKWSLTLQREVGDWVFSADYTGSSGVHLWVQNASNLRRWVGWPLNPAAGTEKQWVRDANGDEAERILPAIGELRTQAPDGNSSYHGLALSANKRFSRGFRAQFAYNYSKAIDDGAGLGNNTENLTQGLRGIYFWDMHLRKALSQQDIRNSLVSNFSYELPRGDYGGIGGGFLNGWKINGILSLLDGTPLTIIDDSREQRSLIGDRSNLLVNLVPGGNRNPVLGTPSDGKKYYFDPSQFIPSVCRAGVYCFENTGVDSDGFPIIVPDSRGRERPECLGDEPGEEDLGCRPGYFGSNSFGTLTSPGLFTFDFSILKDFNVTETSRIQFRAEFFNIFNRPNFGAPGGDDIELFKDRGAPDPTEAEITETYTSARQIQFSLKFLF